MSFAHLLFVTAPKWFRSRLGDFIFFLFFMLQWIDARRGAPWEATHEKSVVNTVRLQGKDHSQNPSAIT